MPYPTTIEAIKAVLKSDPSVSVSQREEILNYIRRGGPKHNTKQTNTSARIVRRNEAAKMLGCSLRMIDRLLQQGVLKKIILPQRKRGAGVLEGDLLELMGLYRDTNEGQSNEKDKAGHNALIRKLAVIQNVL